MIHRISVEALAADELEDAYRYYEDRQNGLGAAFKDEFSRCVERISKFPESAEPVVENVHRALMARFPYGIIYELLDREIVIFAISNLKRQPNYWIDRL